MAVITVTTENFQQQVLDSVKKVLVDFYADWCGPCQAMAPAFDALSDEVGDVVFCRINVDEEPALARQFTISSIPTLVVFEQGKVTQRSVGGRAKDGILALIR